MKIVMTLLFSMILCSCKGQGEKNTTEATRAATGESAQTDYPVQKSESEWRKELTDIEFYVLREGATENPGSSDLLDNKQAGTYVCAGCGTPLFESEHKFDSGTGWPSFDQEIEGNVAYSREGNYGMFGIEEHCAVCGGHLGHVFDDGPRQTTGLRHCINGAALDFIPAE